jgi:hypothetical protein
VRVPENALPRRCPTRGQTLAGLWLNRGLVVAQAWPKHVSQNR